MIKTKLINITLRMDRSCSSCLVNTKSQVNVARSIALGAIPGGARPEPIGLAASDLKILLSFTFTSSIILLFH